MHSELQGNWNDSKLQYTEGTKTSHTYPLSGPRPRNLSPRFYGYLDGVQLGLGRLTTLHAHSGSPQGPHSACGWELGAGSSLEGEPGPRLPLIGPARPLGAGSPPR
ncbi:hypothetical protein R6Z07F_004778 [Ovis aries]